MGIKGTNLLGDSKTIVTKVDNKIEGQNEGSEDNTYNLQLKRKHVK